MAIARVSAVDICREALAAEGSVLLNHLCRVLESDSGSAKENACVALEALTLGRESATSVVSRGGIGTLLEICRSGTPSAVASAAGVLKNLAGVKELRRRFIEENAVPVLIRVLSSGTPLAMGNSVGCLRNLAAEEGGECVNMLLLKEGILNCLLNYWEKCCELEPVIGLIRNLALSGYGLHAVQLSGLLPRVVSAMDSLSSAVRAEATRTVAEFSGKLGREKAAELVPKLVRMLEAKGDEEKAAAVQTLASLVTTSSGSRRAFRREEKGIVNAVMLLDPLLWSVDKRYPVMVLLSVSQSRRCRRQMAACGACEYLKRLVVSEEVEGAKRLKDSLERGKIFGVFPRN